MKFTIERGALLKSLGHVQSVVERRNTIPILSNVRLEAGDEVILDYDDGDNALYAISDTASQTINVGALL